MKLTLIITTYNRPDSLELVLKSVENQKIIPEEVIVSKKNALLEELVAFTNSIRNDSKIAVSGTDGLRALKTAMEIQKIIENSMPSLGNTKTIIEYT